MNNGVVSWAVAITTAPRKEPSIERCLSSVRSCGWEPIVFAEPGSTPVDAETINNAMKFGLWHNWLSACRHCLLGTEADVILTIQDDIELHPDSKGFIESILWPDENAGFISLYTSRRHSHEVAGRGVGVNELKTDSMWGACALAFPRKVIEELVDSDFANQWLGAATRSRSRTRREFARRRANPSLIRHSDCAISRFMNMTGRTMWIVEPSPAVHFSKHSTIGNGGNRGGRNCYRPANHSILLKEQVHAGQTNSS